MSTSPEKLDTKELTYISDQDFLTTKFVITQKIIRLLVEAENLLKSEIQKSHLEFPDHFIQKTGKISKGENYRNLPYVVLDYPRYFRQDEVFAFRTMFWWGNYFSSTLHVQGEWLEKYKRNIINNLTNEADETLICINQSPWEYHDKNDNYQLVKELTFEELSTLVSRHPFLKLSKNLNLSDYQKIPAFSLECYQNFIKLFNISK